MNKEVDSTGKKFFFSTVEGETTKMHVAHGVNIHSTIVCIPEFFISVSKFL